MPAEPSYVPSMTGAGLVTAEELLYMSIPDKRAWSSSGVWSLCGSPQAAAMGVLPRTLRSRS